MVAYHKYEFKLNMFDMYGNNVRDDPKYIDERKMLEAIYQQYVWESFKEKEPEKGPW